MTGCWTSRTRRRARLPEGRTGSNEYSTSMRRLRRESTRVIAIIVKCLWFHVKCLWFHIKPVEFQDMFVMQDMVVDARTCC